jgi:hypothetical protein
MKSMRVAVVSGVALCAIAWSSACHRRTAVGAASREVAPDWIMGTLSVTGTTFDQQFVLRGSGGVKRLRTTSGDSASLVRMGNVELLVRGADGAGEFTVVSFRALRVDGQPVVDGTLRRDGERYYLETSDGPLSINRTPTAFSTLVGARLWISGPLDTGPIVYGVIRPAN